MSLFINNDHYNTYIDICKQATSENRIYDSLLYETHHIIPKSMGGTDDEDNLVILTFEEHYYVHMLLVRCVKYDKDLISMTRALSFMSLSHDGTPQGYSDGRRNRILECRNKPKKIKKAKPKPKKIKAIKPKRCKTYLKELVSRYD